MLSALLGSILIDLSFEWSYGTAKIFSNADLAPQATVAIVPGAAVYGKTASPILMDRLEGALQLYKKKKVKKILLSGDHGTKSYNELKPMLKFMLKNGVNESDIFVDHAGFRTLDTLVRAKLIFDVRDAFFVSQKFHQPRAIYIGEKLGMQIIPFEADLRPYHSEGYNRLREFFARNLAWMDMNLFHTSPRYLGTSYPITGNGEKTWKGSVL